MLPALRRCRDSFGLCCAPCRRDGSGQQLCQRASAQWLEAWRQLAEPINDDKQLVQKELLPLMTNPKPAATMDKVVDAVRDWDTNMRLFKAAGGASRRITSVVLL